MKNCGLSLFKFKQFSCAGAVLAWCAFGAFAQRALLPNPAVSGRPSAEPQALLMQADAALTGALGAEDFSVGRRVAAGFMNLALGLGSFTMKDWMGGSVIVAGYAVSAVLIVWELTGMKRGDTGAGVPGTIGVCVAGGAAAFGFVRPFFFHRPGTGGGTAAVSGIVPKIGLASGVNGTCAVSVSYTVSF